MAALGCEAQTFHSECHIRIRYVLDTYTFTILTNIYWSHGNHVGFYEPKNLCIRDVSTLKKIVQIVCWDRVRFQKGHHHNVLALWSHILPKRHKKFFCHKKNTKLIAHISYKDRNFKYFIQGTCTLDWIQILF